MAIKEAKDLIEKFQTIKFDSQSNFENAKECALIFVEEILSYKKNLYMIEGNPTHLFFENLKSEVEKWTDKNI